MHDRVKLTKRQIKEDRFTTIMLNSKQYASENWQYVALGAIGIILVIFAISYFASSASSRMSEAASRFSQALLENRNGNNQVAILSFTQIVDDFGGEEVAEQSTFLLGRINYDIRNYVESQRYYKLYLSNYPNDKVFRSAAQAGIASSLENLGQNAEAAASFELAYHELREGPLAGDYLVSAMRTFLASDNRDKAQEYLDLLSEEFSGTTLFNRASRLFAEKTVQ